MAKCQGPMKLRSVYLYFRVITELLMHFLSPFPFDFSFSTSFGISFQHVNSLYLTTMNEKYKHYTMIFYSPSSTYLIFEILILKGSRN